MLARKILLYLIPPVVIGCLLAGFYLQKRAKEKAEGELPNSTPEVQQPAVESPMGPNAEPQEVTVPENSTQVVDNQQLMNNSTNPGATSEPTLEELTVEAKSFSESPFWLKLLAQSEPAMRLVRTIDAFANGERPVDALDFLHVDTPFTAQQDSEGNYVATRMTYARYQVAVDFVASLDPRKAAEWFIRAEPALQQCCRKLGYQDKSIRQLLTEAFNTILTTPQFDFDPLLVPTGTTGTYHFVDPDFESLNDAQKLLVRLGPENCAIIQAKCSAIADALKLYRTE
ncbi:MAG: DUF3014 domain-containing protein [Victivallales bacterium]|nr:DUF3014 domain-containing protein [Victivallales bacterium]